MQGSDVTPYRLRELQDLRVYGEHASGGECGPVAWEVRTHPNYSDGWRVTIAVPKSGDVRASVAKHRVNYRGVAVVGWTRDDDCIVLCKFVRGMLADAESFAREWSDKASKEEPSDE